MISSKQLLEQTGISRATLNNYVQLGILPRPETAGIDQQDPRPGRAMSFFPQDSIERVNLVQELKTYGQSIPEIANLLNQRDWASKVEVLRASQSDVMVKVARRSGLHSS